MRILITGGCGFVGRRFAHRLLETDDNEVLIVDNLVSGIEPDKWMFQPRYKERMTFRYVDCRQLFRGKHFDPSAFDAVIHCAAIVGGRLTIDGDPLAVATDLSIDAELFNWVVRAKHKPKVVYFSSSAVYPLELQTEQHHVALAELLVTFDGMRFGKPDMSYGWAKLTGEYLAKFAREQYDLDVRVFRPFGGYGEDQGFDYPFPSIIKRVLDKEDPVVVWGSGNQERDFIYIEDIIDAVLKTLYLRAAPTLNLGTGKATSFMDLAKLACRSLGHKADIQALTDKPQGVYSRVADPYLMSHYYKPKTTLAEGILKVARALELTRATA